MKEIEKKFFVDKNYRPPKDVETIKIYQNYLLIKDDFEIRLRAAKHYDKNKKLIKQSFTKTSKKGSGDIREEKTKHLTKEQFKQEYKDCIGDPLYKIRHLIPYKNKTIELDIFPEKRYNIPTVAEIEFDSEKEMNNFNFPDWFKEETSLKNKDIFIKFNEGFYDRPLRYS
ncbi:MAG: hypothetical protein ACOCRO_04025 [Halanaerobiales bacterium]